MGKNTNQIATGDDFYTTGAYIRGWSGLKRCPTRGEAATYLGIATTPADKCIKYSDWTTKKLSKTPRYYVEINGNGDIVAGTIDRFFDNFYFEGIPGKVEHWRWNNNLNDDVFMGYESTDRGFFQASAGTTGGWYSHDIPDVYYDSYGSFYPDEGTYSFQSGTGYLYTISITSVTIPSSSEV